MERNYLVHVSRWKKRIPLCWLHRSSWFERLELKLIMSKTKLLSFCGFALSLLFSIYLVISIPSTFLSNMKDTSGLLDKIKRTDDVGQLKQITTEMLSSCSVSYKFTNWLLYGCIGFGVLSALLFLIIFRITRAIETGRQGEGVLEKRRNGPAS